VTPFFIEWSRTAAPQHDVAVRLHTRAWRSASSP
jgi:hypothetical protein